MVMPVESQVAEEEQTDLGMVESDVDEGLAIEDVPAETEAVAEQKDAAPSQMPAAEEVPAAQVPPPAPPVDQRAVNELRERRLQDVHRQWQENVGKQARSYEKQMVDGGYDPEQARDQARRYVQQEQRFRKQEQESADMLGFLQGRQAAAMHFMEQHGLASKQAMADLKSLQKAESPEDMEKEAKRMKDDRALRAENARLKQGTVPPQTFDSSQGAAEATTNDARLLQAYIDGDRSEAATAAVRKMM
jgi:hypothetical protein